VLVAVVGSGAGWYVRDRTTRRAVLAARVSDALDESERLYRAGQVPEALNAAQRAASLLATGPADEALTARVGERVEDLQTVLKFDDGLFAGPVRRGAEYERLFRNCGIDLKALPAEEAAARIRGRFIAVDLAVALDLWAGNCRDPLLREKLLAVARQADHDPWRDRARQDQDAAALEELARTAPVDKLPPATLRTIVIELGRRNPKGSSDQPVRDFLLRAQRRYPSDLWLNQLLGDSYLLRTPRDYKEAAGFYRILEALRPNSPHGSLHLAIVMHNQGNTEEAVAYLRDAIALKPDDANNRFWAADEFQQIGRLDEAIAEYREALRLNPNDVYGYCNLATALHRKGLTDEALATLRKAIALYPDDPGIRCSLGEAFQGMGRLDEAIAEFQEAIRIDKDLLEAHIGRGMTFAERGEWEKAAADFARAAGLKDARAVVQYYQALLCLRAGDAGGYRDSCAGMLKRWGTSDSFTLWTCVLAPNAVGDPMALANGAEKAVGKEPKDLMSANSLGAALYRAGRYDEAARQLTRASGLDPGRTSLIYTWFFLAMTHHRLGHAPQARQWLDKALQATDRALDPSATPAGGPARDASDPAGGIPPAWNRRLTLELLRRETVELLKVQTAEPELAPMPQEVP
jgi:tetratricopeptide (TPR) repeat protein